MIVTERERVTERVIGYYRNKHKTRDWSCDPKRQAKKFWIDSIESR